MPRIRHDGSLALRAVDGEELVWLVVGIRIAHGHDDLTGLDIELPTSKLLVDPELLDVHLAALLHFSLILAGLLGLDLHGAATAAMLKLHLAAQRPALAEVIAKVQTYVRQVKTPMTLVVSI